MPYFTTAARIFASGPTERIVGEGLSMAGMCTATPMVFQTGSLHRMVISGIVLSYGETVKRPSLGFLNHIIISIIAAARCKEA